jgi:DNA-binding cell septation regulator SpoVG
MYFCVTRVVKWYHHTALKAFCDVAVDRELLIRGIRVVEGRHGVFVGMPRQKMNGSKQWHEVVVPLTRETKIELARVILKAFQHATATGGARWPVPVR